MTPVVIPDVYVLVLGKRSVLADLELRAVDGTVDIELPVADERVQIAMTAEEALRVAAHLRELAFALKPALRKETT